MGFVGRPGLEYEISERYRTADSGDKWPAGSPSGSLIEIYGSAFVDAGVSRLGSEAIGLERDLVRLGAVIPYS